MEHEFRFLEYEGIQIAAFIEGRNQNEHSSYYPKNILFYVEQGQLNVRLSNQLYTITSGKFCLVRKFTNGSYFKTWDEDQTHALVKAMVLQDDFIATAIDELGLSKPQKEIRQSVFQLENNSILTGLYNSLIGYLADNESPDKQLMFLKTKEALLGILKSNPEYLAVFYEFSKPVKADLREFMNHQITSNESLATLAKQSGRSLSTFNRDFKKIFQTSPHSWLLKKRLQMAKEILVTQNRKSSEIYLELGFKDLAHFSKTFKKEFGVPPSQFSNK